MSGNYSEYERNAQEKQQHMMRLQEGLNKKKAHMEKSIQASTPISIPHQCTGHAASQCWRKQLREVQADVCFACMILDLALAEPCCVAGGADACKEDGG